MKRLCSIVITCTLLFPSILWAATQQEIQQAIDDGLAYLAGSMTTSGDEGYWSYSNNGTLAATAAAVLAFVEEGYLPGTDVEIGGTNYGDVVGKACDYIFQFQLEEGGFSTYGREGAKEEYQWTTKQALKRGKYVPPFNQWVPGQLRENELSCLMGNVVTALLRFGYAGDKRVKKACD